MGGSFGSWFVSDYQRYLPKGHDPTVEYVTNVALTENFTNTLVSFGDLPYKSFVSLVTTVIWRFPNLSELISIVFNAELTHLGSEVSISYNYP